MKSAVLITPVELLDAANAFADVMGWGYPCYTIPLSATGQEPATHWGARATVYGEFLALLADPPEGYLVGDLLVELPPFTVTPENEYVSKTIQIDLSDTDDGYTHFFSVVEERGISQILPQEISEL